jgi:hypothetical protein
VGMTDALAEGGDPPVSMAPPSVVREVGFTRFVGSFGAGRRERVNVRSSTYRPHDRRSQESATR